MGLFGLGKGGLGETAGDKPDKDTDGKEKPDGEVKDAAKDGANAKANDAGDGKSKKDDENKNADEKGEKSDIHAIIQSAIAEAVSEATKGLKADNDALKSQVSELMRKGLTPEQIKELDEREKTAAQNKREADITKRENRFYALTAIKEAGLDDGGKTALELIDLVMGNDPKEIDAKVKSLSKLVKKMVSAEVEKTFKDNGRSPESGKGADDGKKNDVAKRLGQRTAKLNEQSRKTLDFYLGGNK